MKLLTFLPLMLFNLLRCSAEKMPEQPLVKISYSYGSQMLAYPEYELEISAIGDSVYAIRFDTDRMTHCRYLLRQDGIMATLRSVIADNKIYKYQEHYMNPHVLDGWSWRYQAKFQQPDASAYDFTLLSSSGSNAGPKGDGLRRLQAAMDQALLDAEFLYTCNTEGEEIPDVSFEMRQGDNMDCDYLYLIRNEYYGQLDYRFHDTDTSQMFQARYGEVKPVMHNVSLQTRIERCFGARLIDDGHSGSPIVYLIMQGGYAEAVAVDDLVKSAVELEAADAPAVSANTEKTAPRTTRHSITHDLTDIQLIDGIVKGIDKQGNVTDIIWETEDDHQ